MMRPCLVGFAAALTACLSLPLFAAEKKAWISMGDAAFHQVRQFVPDIVSIESRQLAGGGEIIHAVSLAESRLETVSGLVHQRMRRCGGFVFHETEADARAALRNVTAAGSSLSYSIDHRDLVEPVLAQMGDKNIEATILGLSAFPNRYYKSQAGVDASNWLTSHWRELAQGRPDTAVHAWRLSASFGHPEHRRQRQAG